MSIDAEFIVPKSKPVPDNLKSDPFGQPVMTLIVGQCGSGKTTLLMNLLLRLEKLHDFDSALFVTGNNQDPLLKAIDMPITTSPADLAEFINQKRNNTANGTKHLLVLDDIQGSPDFNIFSTRSEFVKFILSHRHFGEDPSRPGQHGVWVIATAQSLKNSYSTTMRNQIKNFFLYYPNRHPTEVKSFEEIAQDPIAMRKAMEIVKSEGAHSFLYVNKHDPEKDRYFLGFKKELKDFS